MTEHYRHEKVSECPNCGESLEVSTPVPGSVPTPPAEGDLSVCFHCGTIMIFTDDKGALRKVTLDDLKKLDDATALALHHATASVLERLAEERKEAAS